MSIHPRVNRHCPVVVAQSTKKDIDDFYGCLQTTVSNISKREILMIQGDGRERETERERERESVFCFTL